jgi:hypothetical protein
MRIANEVQNFDAATRWIVRKLRVWLDRADDVVHGWEVNIRKSQSFPLTNGEAGAVDQVRDLQPPRGHASPADGEFQQRAATPRRGIPGKTALSQRRATRVTARGFDEWLMQKRAGLVKT